MQIKCNFFAEKSNSFTFFFVTLLQKGLRLWFRIGVWRRLNVHSVVVGLLKGDVLDERLGVDILLLHLTVGGDALSHHDAFRLRLEEHTARGNRRGGAVHEFLHADARESHLEDADASQPNLLAQFEEVLDGLAQFGQRGHDVALLERGLRLGEKVQVRLCSTPKKQAADIYEMLGYKKMPFWRKIKVCSTQ